MSHNIKHIFTALDLEVDDLMYDTEKNIIVRVALVGPVVSNTIFESTLFGVSSKAVSTRQIVIEHAETKELYVIVTSGKEGNDLPFGRFKYLIKNRAPIIITSGTMSGTYTLNGDLCVSGNSSITPNIFTIKGSN